MSDYHRYDTYNPSTGLPMVGAVDIGGYAIGQSYWDRHRAPTSSFNNNNSASTVSHGSSAFDFGTYSNTATNSGVENDISSSQSKIIQIAFVTFVGTVTTAGFVAIVLGFAGVF